MSYRWSDAGKVLYRIYEEGRLPHNHQANNEYQKDKSNW